MKSPRRVTLLASAAIAAMLGVAGCATAEAEAPAPASSGTALAEITTVKVAVSSKIAYFLPYLMEEHWGEFGKQNIKIEMEYAPAPDALVLLATGRVDAMVTGPSANILNAVGEGSDIKMVAPGGIEPDDSINGWYVSTKALDGKDFEPKMLKGKTLSSSSGVAGPPLLTLSRVLEDADLSLADVTIKSMPSADGVVAIENGAVFAGTVSHPNTAVVEEAGSGEFFARSAPEGWPSVNVFFGPNLLMDRPEVGDAFVLALLNTYKNHMQGDFMHDPDNIEAIAEVLETDLEIVEGIPSAFYPTELEFPKRYLEAYEAVFRQIPGVISYGDKKVAADVLESRYMDYANKNS